MPRRQNRKVEFAARISEQGDDRIFQFDMLNIEMLSESCEALKGDDDTLCFKHVSHAERRRLGDDNIGIGCDALERIDVNVAAGKGLTEQGGHEFGSKAFGQGRQPGQCAEQERENE